MMSEPLFNEFDDASAKQWKQKIQFDLKGADYNDMLIWQSDEDISVKPFYHPDDFKDLPEPSNTNASQWKICQSIYVADAKRANKKALNDIENGAESILFVLPSEAVSVEGLLLNIDLNAVSIYFELQFLSLDFVKKLNACYLERSQYLAGSTASSNKIHIFNDIIGNLAKNGNWFNNLNEDFRLFESIVKTTNAITIDASLYQNSGANMVQQLAYALAHCNEYLSRIDDYDMTNGPDSYWEKQSLQCMFYVSIGSNYFFEIAKLRALRLLYKTIAPAYQIHTDCHIVATPTKRNKTLYAYNTNMLRTTTECMSAVLGGADTICNLPQDAFFHKTNTFGDRMARNQLLILKHESYFDKVDNPADGSYYIETLMQQLAEKAFELFKDIEANGGFLKQLKDGIIQRKIKERAAKEQKHFESEETVLVGTNKYTNPNDQMKDELELYPFAKKNPRKTLIEPIIERRLSEILEQKRLKGEV